MPQSHHSVCSNEIEHPACAKCRAPMVITHIDEIYPGRNRRKFECLKCSTAMTEWGRLVLERG
jgi:hypothetical protein